MLMTEEQRPDPDPDPDPNWMPKEQRAETLRAMKPAQRVSPLGAMEAIASPLTHLRPLTRPRTTASEVPDRTGCILLLTVEERAATLLTMPVATRAEVGTPSTP